MIVLDCVVLILLGLSTLYLLRLNKRVAFLRDTKNELAMLMQGFDEAIMRAEMSVSELKQLSTDSSVEFQKKIDKANYLTNDLAFMTDRATELTTKLEKGIYLAKEMGKISNKAYNSKSIGGDPYMPLNRTKPSEIPEEAITSSQPLRPTIPTRERTPTIDALLKRISAAQSNKNSQKTMEEKKENKSYKPSITRQKEYFESLRRV